MDTYQRRQEMPVEPYSCRKCGTIYSSTTNKVSIKSGICCACRRKAIPKHITEVQHVRYLELNGMIDFLNRRK